MACTFMVLNEVTYHLHKEASDLNRLLRLRAAAPDSAATTLQSGNIGNSIGEIAVKAFATDSGVPAAAVVRIPNGTPITSVCICERRPATASSIRACARG
jgi:hypothetical protein